MSHTTSNKGLLALVLLLAGGFITMFDMFVVNLAIPNIQTDLKADLSQIGLVIVAYQLTFGIFLIAGSRLGDIYGRRRLYQLGMFGFALTSAFCAIAWTVNILIVARLFQGASAALLLPQVYSLIRINYDEDERRKAFGLLGMTLGVAAISGQILGGLIVQANFLELGWRLIFIINVPICIVITWLCKAVNESKVEDSTQPDWLGTLTASMGLSLILFALMKGESFNWSMLILITFVFGVIILTIFAKYELFLLNKGGHPAIDMRLFKNRIFGFGAAVVLLISSTSSSFFLCMALLLQSGFGYDPFIAGMVFVPANLLFSLTSLAAPRLVSRFSNRIIGMGMLLYAVAIATLSGLVAFQESHLLMWYLIPAMCLFGAGQAMSMTPMTNLIIGKVSIQQAGMAAGVISTMQQVGGALGVAIVSILFIDLISTTGHGVDNVIERYTFAFSGSLLYNVAAAIIAAIITLSMTWSQVLSAKGLR